MTPSPNEPKKKIPEWHQQQEVVLKGWAEAAACYRYMHHQSFQKFRKSNMRYTLPVIILSTITGTANFAQDSFGEGLKPYVAPGIGGLNLIAGLIATVSQFLKLSEYMESHRAAANSFGKFSRNIRLELSLPLKDRTKDGPMLIEECRAEYDRLLEQSPNIPQEILEEFEFVYKDVETLYKPEIICIHPVRRYNAIRENTLVKKLKSLAQSDESREELMKELGEIRRSGQGNVTAPKNLALLKHKLKNRNKGSCGGCLSKSAPLDLSGDDQSEMSESPTHLDETIIDVEAGLTDDNEE